MEQQTQTFLGEAPIKKAKGTYICPFCSHSRQKCNKTDIKYKGKWMSGCQGCFLDSIEDPDKFDKIKLKVNHNK